MLVDEKLYWTPHNILTYNAMMNYVIGGRGTGKTFGSLRYGVKRYLQRGDGFIYLRRYETDLKKRERLLRDVSAKFPKYELQVEGQRLQIRRVKLDNKRKWLTMGYAMPLSSADSDKSVPYNDIHTIIYDEFIKTKGMQQYIRNEPELLLDFYNTVDRYDDRVRLICLANSVSIVNPHFIYHGISPRHMGVTVYKGGTIAVERLHEQAFVDAVDSTRFGQLVKGTPYYDYAVGNEFTDDHDDFIMKKPSTSSFYTAFKFDEQMFAVWSDYEHGCMFVNQKPPKDNIRTYVLTKEDFQPNLLMISKSSPLLKGIVRLYMQGSLFFDSTKTRELFYTMLDFLNLR